MIRTIVITILFILFSTNYLPAQTPLTSGLYEIQGSMLFSYSNQSGPPERNQTFDRYRKEFNLSLQPSIGYFITEKIEFTLQPDFSLEFSKYNYSTYVSDPSGSRIEEYYTEYQIYTLSLLTGIYYHIPLSDRVSSFLGTAAGVSWQKIIANDPNGTIQYIYGSTTWGKPTLRYPNLSAGAKFFLTDKWALIPMAQLTYTRLSADRPYDQYEQSIDFSFGVGLAVYINPQSSADTRSSNGNQ